MPIPNYLIADIENNAGPESKALGRKVGHPMFDALVAIGLKNVQELHSTYIYPNKLKEFKIDEDLLVGHNLAHDLQWLWHLDDVQDFFKRGGRIWDTSVVEYILTAQEHIYPALRVIAVNKYGCQEREKFMEKYWDEGLQTSQIPEEIVLKDVENDVLDTEQVFLKQYTEISRLGLHNFIELQMDAVLATIECSMNGMKIDLETLQKNKIELQQRLDIKTKELLEIVKKYWR